MDATNTLRIFFDVKSNSGTAPLRVLGGPYSFFRRMRVLCGNQLVEDIDYYNRTHYMFDILRAQHVRENEDVEGFGEDRFDHPLVQPFFQTNNNAKTNVAYPSGPMESFKDNFVSIPAGGTKTVSFKPLSGLLSCGKLLPLRWAPITIELELVQNATDVIISTNSVPLVIAVDDAGATAAGITPANTSLVWPSYESCD